MKFDNLKDVLYKYNQEHILNFYEKLNDDKKELLKNQIEKIDFEQMKSLYNLAINPTEQKNALIEPTPCINSLNLSEEEKNNYIKIGEEIIRSGKLAVVTMAGGQGTRLGHNGPKGTFDMGLDTHKSLFEILTDDLKETKEKYNVAVPWYIMTSRENNDETEKFFKEHDYFGYPHEAVRMFFKQGELPMLDECGKLIIDERGLIKEAADGHGGIFEAMFKNDVLTDMKKNNIEWIFIGSVDNPLVKMTDPLFIGFAAYHNYMAASKTLKKAYPEEKVGVFCKKNGKPYVIEYTEISDDMANKKNDDGELIYGESHVLLNIFNISTLEKIKEVKLPYHVAHKKATYMNESGKIIVPNAPNAYKFESFIFDAFSLLDEVGLIRGDREEEFAPIKNATGNDSPKTARELYLNYQAKRGK